jgi:hypothetical protein
LNKTLKNAFLPQFHPSCTADISLTQEECTLYYATFSRVPPLGVPLQNDNMKAHIYFYQIIGYIVFLQSSLYHKLRVKFNILLGCTSAGDANGRWLRKCSILKPTLLLVPLQNDNMKAHIYFYQFIQFWNYTIITYCSSALDTRRSVSTKMLHFLKHRPLVSLAEKQHFIYNIYRQIDTSLSRLSNFRMSLTTRISLLYLSFGSWYMSSQLY